DATLALGQLERAEELVETIDALRPGDKPPFLRAQAARFRARLAAARGETEGVDSNFTDAERTFREFRIPFWLGVTELEHAEWLTDEVRAGEAEPVLAEARQGVGRLEAA